MADERDYREADPDTRAGSGGLMTAGAPRWVKVFGAIALIVVVLLAVLLLAGGGPGGHGPGRHAQSGAVAQQPAGVPGLGSAGGHTPHPGWRAPS